MPSPGSSAIAAAIAPLAFSVSGIATAIQPGWSTAVRLGRALDAGWTCASPSTSSTMTAAMAAEFSDMAGGWGLAWASAIGIGIDAETAAWAASWNDNAHLHTYAPSTSSVYAAIAAACPYDSEAIRAINQRVAEVFIADFVQEAG
jgi:hypothetical protein